MWDSLAVRFSKYFGFDIHQYYSDEKTRVNNYELK